MNTQTRELLLWIEREPRVYTETVDIWRTSCPRLSIWEDAISDGLIDVVRHGPDTRVVVTARGRTILADE